LKANEEIKNACKGSRFIGTISIETTKAFADAFKKGIKHECDANNMKRSGDSRQAGNWERYGSNNMAGAASISFSRQSAEFGRIRKVREARLMLLPERHEARRSIIASRSCRSAVTRASQFLFVEDNYEISAGTHQD